MTGRNVRNSRWNGGHPALWSGLLAVLLILAGCEQKSTFTPPPPPTVTVSPPIKRQVTDYLEFTGNTQAVNTVQLRARVEGYLDKVLFQDGEKVKKGQTLFLIQRNTYDAKLMQAEAQILAQKARLQQAETEFARFSALVSQRAASHTDLDKWQYERDSARAAVMQAEAQRDLARLDLGYTQVTAPFDGRIDRRLKDPGNVVGAGEQTVLAEINQINPIYVYFTITERDLLRLMREVGAVPGQVNGKKCPLQFGLADEKGYPHEGSLDFASITVSSTTGTLLLRGVFPNPDHLIMPGLFARVRATVGDGRSALLVPQMAVGFDQQGSYVLIVNDKNVVERRAVTPGGQVDDLRVIEEGLVGDERVVVNGILKAIPGREVTPQQEQPSSPVSGTNTITSPPAGERRAAQ